MILHPWHLPQTTGRLRIACQGGMWQSCQHLLPTSPMLDDMASALAPPIFTTTCNGWTLLAAKAGGRKKKNACLQLSLPSSHPERVQTHSNSLQSKVKNKSLLLTEQRLHWWSSWDHCAPWHPSNGQPHAVVQHSPSSYPLLLPHPMEKPGRRVFCCHLSFHSPGVHPWSCSQRYQWLRWHTVISKKKLNSDNHRAFPVGCWWGTTPTPPLAHSHSLSLSVHFPPSCIFPPVGHGGTVAAAPKQGCAGVSGRF